MAGACAHRWSEEEMRRGPADGTDAAALLCLVKTSVRLPHPSRDLGQDAHRTGRLEACPIFVNLRFNAKTPEWPRAFDSPLSGGRFSLSPRERGGVRGK